MQTRFLPALAFGAALFLVVSNRPATGQPDNDADAVAVLIDDVTAQQTKIIANQAAMEEKIALITEEVRQARLFAARGGRGGGGGGVGAGGTANGGGTVGGNTGK